MPVARSGRALSHHISEDSVLELFVLFRVPNSEDRSSERITFNNDGDDDDVYWFYFILKMFFFSFVFSLCALMFVKKAAFLDSHLIICLKIIK